MYEQMLLTYIALVIVVCEIKMHMEFVVVVKSLLKRT